MKTGLHPTSEQFVTAGPVLRCAFDPYERALRHFAVFGSEVGCRRGDD
jgi:hypothetical protein